MFPNVPNEKFPTKPNPFALALLTSLSKDQRHQPLRNRSDGNFENGKNCMYSAGIKKQLKQAFVNGLCRELGI
jgi:hypothetical protein